MSKDDAVQELPRGFKIGDLVEDSWEHIPGLELERMRGQIMGPGESKPGDVLVRMVNRRGIGHEINIRADRLRKVKAGG